MWAMGSIYVRPVTAVLKLRLPALRLGGSVFDLEVNRTYFKTSVMGKENLKKWLTICEEYGKIKHVVGKNHC